VDGRPTARRAATKRKPAELSPAVHRAAMLFSLVTTLAIGSAALIAVAPQPLRPHSPAALTAIQGEPPDDAATLSGASLAPEQELP
jgi:hypothetical protein